MFLIYRSEAATDPLKQTWQTADADRRDAILAASHRLNRRLADRPLEQGESRDGETRILFETPVAALYEVDEARRIVRILRSWSYG